MRSQRFTKALITAAAIAFTGLQAHASDALAAKNGCVACHAKDRKLVGPAFKDVAAKYAGDAGARDRLAAKVKRGGSGVWGNVPMPPNPQVTDADLKALLTWILSTK